MRNPGASNSSRRGLGVAWFAPRQNRTTASLAILLIHQRPVNRPRLRGPSASRPAGRLRGAAAGDGSTGSTADRLRILPKPQLQHTVTGPGPTDKGTETHLREETMSQSETGQVTGKRDKDSTRSGSPNSQSLSSALRPEAYIADAERDGRRPRVGRRGNGQETARQPNGRSVGPLPEPRRSEAPPHCPSVWCRLRHGPKRRTGAHSLAGRSGGTLRRSTVNSSTIRQDRPRPQVALLADRGRTDRS